MLADHFSRHGVLYIAAKASYRAQQHFSTTISYNLFYFIVYEKQIIMISPAGNAPFCAVGLVSPLCRFTMMCIYQLQYQMTLKLSVRVIHHSDSEHSTPVA